ncbi:hypothetical protein IscW_ISCW008518 [Ixodes scapularis]|uniref:PDZ domain-containing protein n=1 Tax=Ixodes scapularis TaxID=6945 RepID=B7Q028_IXOSC|nr:hypothetical protein IscW_ISCW008518 [Ixodes scapularis]|eukprot:XP_002406754.1 hypothetical protein IscW_ISCW008518 [Ixodes scapularis]
MGSLWWRVRWRYGGSRHCRGHGQGGIASGFLCALCLLLPRSIDHLAVVFSAQVDPGGKAATDGGVRVGDLVLCVNDVRCSQLDQVLQLIDSAFSTVTLLLWRR